jgi:undecaprenyl-diphosphatase
MQTPIPTPKIEPPQVLPPSWDRRLYMAIHGLPHSPVGDRYVTMLSDVGEGAGWVVAGIALAWLGGQKGRRAGLAVSVAALGTTYFVQRIVKPVFRRKRPWVDRDIAVVGIRTTDPSFPSGHAAASFAAATALTAYYPKTAPLAYTLATGVAASRVHLGHHFPSDTVAGAALGVAAGSLVAWVTKRPVVL